VSYFVFGEIGLRETSDARGVEELCFAIALAAFRAHLGIQLGGNIIHGDIYRMLRRSREGSYLKSIPYLLTDSPISDHSSELVRPDAYFRALDDRRVGLRPAAVKLEAFVSEVRGMADVGALSLWLTQGFDTEFAETSVRIGGVADRWCEILSGATFHSHKLTIEV